MAGLPADEPVQLLSPEGERVASASAEPFVALVSDVDGEALRGLYRDMALVRRFDAEAVALQRQGELGLWASLLGQEAAQIGAGRAMRANDMAFPTYREHGVAWCRGVPMANLLGLFRGSTLGGWDPAAHGFALFSIVVGSQTLHATGYAMGLQRDGLVGTDDDQDAAVVAFFGDGASSQGDVNEAFVWAAVTDAPVVFFCQNNQWAISEPLERQTRIPVYRRAHGFGFPGIRVDGNDVLACLGVSRHALDWARGGSGPILIEAFTYRMGAHTTSDDPTRYRLDADVESWRLKDPLERVKAALARSGDADPGFFDAVDQEAEALAEDVSRRCRAWADPDLPALLEHVHTRLSPELRQQQRELAAHAAALQEELADDG